MKNNTYAEESSSSVFLLCFFKLVLPSKILLARVLIRASSSLAFEALHVISGVTIFALLSCDAAVSEVHNFGLLYNWEPIICLSNVTKRTGWLGWDLL